MLNKIIISILCFCAFGIAHAEPKEKIALLSLFGSEMEIAYYSEGIIGSGSYDIDLPTVDANNIVLGLFSEKLSKLNKNITSINVILDRDKRKLLRSFNEDVLVKAAVIEGKRVDADKALIIRPYSNTLKIYMIGDVEVFRSMSGHGFFLARRNYSGPQIPNAFLSVNVILVDLKGERIIENVKKVDSVTTSIEKIFDEEYLNIIHEYVTDGLHDKIKLKTFKDILYQEKFDSVARSILLKEYEKLYGGHDEYDDMSKKLGEMTYESYSFLEDFLYIPKSVYPSIENGIGLASDYVISQVINEIYFKENL